MHATDNRYRPLVRVHTTNGGEIVRPVVRWDGPTYPIWLLRCDGSRMAILGSRIVSVEPVN